jgi:hypothetical protein
MGFYILAVLTPRSEPSQEGQNGLQSFTCDGNRQRRTPRWRRPLWLESLEDRRLLAIQFTAGAYETPANSLDVPLGRMGSYLLMEPMLAVNGREPGNIAVSSEAGLRIGTNAGATFGSQIPFPLPRGSIFSNGDTDLKFDAEGRLFWSNLPFPSGVAVSQIDPTTGATITSTRLSNGPNDDKEFMAIDTSPDSPFLNNIYVVWTEFSSNSGMVLISRSTNQAVTWSSPLVLSKSAEGFVWPSDVAVAPNGDVYVAYHSEPGYTETPNSNPNGTAGQTIVLRSTDGGVSFPQRTLAFGPGQSDVTFNIQSAARRIPGTQFITLGGVQPWVLPDPVRTGNVYVVTADDPTNGSGAPYSRVVFARSTDNGATWSFPQANHQIAPLDGSSFQLFPPAAIDQFGDIVVAWYDNRRGLTNSHGHFLLDVFATYSTDGGLTWATPFQVNQANQPFDPDPGAVIYGGGNYGQTTRIGEYFGIALFGGTAYLAWNGNRFFGATPVDQQVWFGSFGVSGALTVAGTTGDDTITVRSLKGNTDFAEVLVNGQQEYVGLWSALTGITIAATAGNDTINIEDAPAGVPVAVDLGDGSDTVNLSPTAQDLGTLAGTVTIHGGSGNDTLVGSGASNVWNITGRNAGTISSASLAKLVTFASIQNLIGGTANNRFVFSDGAGISGNLDGGNDGGSLDYSASSRSVIVDLQTASATDVGGRIAHIRNVTGGMSGGTGIYNILVGNGGNTLTGGGGRRNLLIAGLSASTLTGGDDDDILIGGSTLYDMDVMSLMAIMDYWSGTSDDYATRVGNLLSGNGVPLLDATTVTSRGGGNTLIGGPGLNLYFGNGTDITDFDPSSGAIFVPV